MLRTPAATIASASVTSDVVTSSLVSGSDATRAWYSDVASPGSPAPTSQRRATAPFAGAAGATAFVSYLNSGPSVDSAATAVSSFSVDARAIAAFGLFDAIT